MIIVQKKCNMNGSANNLVSGYLGDVEQWLGWGNAGCVTGNVLSFPRWHLHWCSFAGNSLAAILNFMHFSVLNTSQLKKKKQVREKRMSLIKIIFHFLSFLCPKF